MQICFQGRCCYSAWQGIQTFILLDLSWQSGFNDSLNLFNRLRKNTGSCKIKYDYFTGMSFKLYSRILRDLVSQFSPVK